MRKVRFQVVMQSSEETAVTARRVEIWGDEVAFVGPVGDIVASWPNDELRSIDGGGSTLAPPRTAGSSQPRLST